MGQHRVDSIVAHSTKKNDVQFFTAVPAQMQRFQNTRGGWSLAECTGRAGACHGEENDRQGFME